MFKKLQAALLTRVDTTLEIISPEMGSDSKAEDLFKSLAAAIIVMLAMLLVLICSTILLCWKPLKMLVDRLRGGGKRTD